MEITAEQINKFFAATIRMAETVDKLIMVAEKTTHNTNKLSNMLQDQQQAKQAWVTEDTALAMLNIKSITTLKKVVQTYCIRTTNTNNRNFQYNRQDLEKYINRTN